MSPSLSPQGEMLATRKERHEEDESFEQARRSILFGERPPQPPSELELLRREVQGLRNRLRVAADVLRGEHDCGDD